MAYILSRQSYSNAYINRAELACIITGVAKPRNVVSIWTQTHQSPHVRRFKLRLSGCIPQHRYRLAPLGDPTADYFIMGRGGGGAVPSAYACAKGQSPNSAQERAAARGGGAGQMLHEYSTGVSAEACRVVCEARLAAVHVWTGPYTDTL